MSVDDDKEWCLRQVREGNWGWFITLRFPRVVDPNFAGNRCNNPHDAFIQWRQEIEWDEGLAELDYVLVKELRENGEWQWHVLLPDVSTSRRRYLRYVWRQLSAGRTWEREIKPDVERLFHYFVYRRGLPIECSVGGQFKEWLGREEEESWERYRRYGRFHI